MQVVGLFCVRDVELGKTKVRQYLRQNGVSSWDYTQTRGRLVLLLELGLGDDNHFANHCFALCSLLSSVG